MSTLKKFLPQNILMYHLYIYQLEEYESVRFISAISKKGLFANSKLRKKAKLTKKAILLIVLAIFQEFIVALILSYLVFLTVNSFIFSVFVFLVAFYFFVTLSFVFLIQAKDLLWPIETILKNRIIKKAKLKIDSLKDLKVIGITGSYGKTTMKETLYMFCKEQYKVVKTEGNNNTPLGIANTILNKLDSKTEIFIVEMGEYVKGDVKALCEIVKPDISIITGINEAHLERYKTMENAISTKFEIVEFAKENATVILNADDQLTLSNYKKYCKNKDVLFYSSTNSEYSEFSIKDYIFNQDGSGQEFKIFKGSTALAKVKTPVIARYIIGNITAGFIIGELLNISSSKLAFATTLIKSVEHRLEPKLNSKANILIIDDTYNGNSNGVKEGIELLNKFESRRKVYVTPGLVETGSLKEEIHTKIGSDLAKVADLVILIKNSSTEFIYKALLESSFKEDSIIWYDNSKDIWEDLYTNLKPNDVVLLQNDWSDNYV